ncbi:MAG TPA: alpha/beta fold hydrolase, partial [Thermomicrobiales bacterium]|nr:alpha/beta fold hydrolase [Thermomicrobiales bacterium]
MRAIEPVESGRLRLQGFEIAYEVSGPPDATPVLLLPTWQIVHSRIWKMQIPFLARTHRVIAWDAPGTGGGERTLDRASVEYDRLAAQAVELLDHLGAPSASLIGYSRGCWLGMTIAARYPERVSRLIMIGGGISEDPRPYPPSRFHERRDSYVGWEKWNAHYWSEHYPDWLDFFFHELFSEPHSTKPIDDGIGWGLETTP